jgi:hypothetical protein
MDPLKLGPFKYEGIDYEFPYEPFYIGKGKGRRLFSHWDDVDAHKPGGNYNKYNRIKESMKANYGVPEVQIIESYLLENEAYDIEKEYIKIIGRSDLNKGPLTNLTDGGEGIQNLNRESRKEAGRKLSVFLKKTGAHKGNRNNMFGNGYLVSGSSNGMYNKTHRKESRDKMSNSKKGKQTNNKNPRWVDINVSYLQSLVKSGLYLYEIIIAYNLKFNTSYNVNLFRRKLKFYNLWDDTKRKTCKKL